MTRLVKLIGGRKNKSPLAEETRSSSSPTRGFLYTARISYYDTLLSRYLIGQIHTMCQYCIILACCACHRKKRKKIIETVIIRNKDK